MCYLCKNILCRGCAAPPVPLTEKEKQANGWNNLPQTQEEMDKLIEQARQAVENPNSVFNNTTFGKRTW